MKDYIIKIALVFVLLFSANSAQATSECYDHWNGDAWHGTGAWAMVMCLDTRTYIACEVQNNLTGKKIIDLHPHIARDQGRVIWTVYDYGISYPYNGKVLDMVCTDRDKLTYTYRFVNVLGFVWGACGPYPNEVAYGGSECVNDQNEQVLTIATDGNGSGSVTRSASGLKCTSGNNGESCYHSPDTSLTITAVPDSGSIFRGWAGVDCDDSSATCELDMSSAKSVTATFMKSPGPPIKYLLLKKKAK